MKDLWTLKTKDNSPNGASYFFLRKHRSGQIREKQIPNTQVGLTMKPEAQTRPSPCITVQVQNRILSHSHMWSLLYAKPSINPWNHRQK